MRGGCKGQRQQGHAGGPSQDSSSSCEGDKGAALPDLQTMMLFYQRVREKLFQPKSNKGPGLVLCCSPRGRGFVNRMPSNPLLSLRARLVLPDTWKRLRRTLQSITGHTCQCDTSIGFKSARRPVQPEVLKRIDRRSVTTGRGSTKKGLLAAPARGPGPLSQARCPRQVAPSPSRHPSCSPGLPSRSCSWLEG